MKKKSISAKPGAAQPAPLSPPGAALKKSKDPMAEELERIKRQTAEYNAKTSDGRLGGIFPCYAASLSTGDTSKAPKYILQDRSGIEERFQAYGQSFESEIEWKMQLADGLAAYIDARREELLKKRDLDTVRETIDTSDRGFYRRQIIGSIIYYPRLVVIGSGTVKIGALHVFDDPGVPVPKPVEILVEVPDGDPADMWEENEDGNPTNCRRIENRYPGYCDALDNAARKPFDNLIRATGEYFEALKTCFPTATEKICIAFQKVQRLKEALQQYASNEWDGKHPLSDATDAAIDAADAMLAAIELAVANGETIAACAAWVNKNSKFFEAVHKEHEKTPDYSIKDTIKDLIWEDEWKACRRLKIETLCDGYTEWMKVYYPKEVRHKKKSNKKRKH